MCEFKENRKKKHRSSKNKGKEGKRKGIGGGKEVRKTRKKCVRIRTKR